MNKNIIYVVVGLVVIFLLFQQSGEVKQVKKLAGESSSRSFTRTSVYTNQDITISINVNPGTGTYYAVDEKVPSGWTVKSASDGGDYTTTPGHIFWVVTSGATIKTYTYVANPNSLTGTQTFTGTIGFESLPEGAIGGTTSVTTVACTSSTETCDGKDNNCNYNKDEGVSEACGTTGCTSTRTCVSSACSDATSCQAGTGTWNNCLSWNTDCGTCCKCSGGTAASPSKAADLTQSVDCTATTCPADGCNLGGCGLHIFSDYPATVANTCSGLEACTTNACTSTCTADTDIDGWAGVLISFTSCYDCNNNDNTIYYSATEMCGDNKDNDCSGAVEIHFNPADWSSPSGFCIGATCCDNLISMDEVLTAIGKWKTIAFPMNDLLTTIGKWKSG